MDTRRAARFMPAAVAVLGGALVLGALVERTDGRLYVFCHTHPEIDRVTWTALALIAGALVASLVGALVLARTRPRTVLPGAACLAAVLLMLSGADATDAYGEELARAAAATGRPDGGSCEYVVPTYTATPGAFFPFT
ncbi:hypothetical protein ACFW6F_35770 [Streptomyces sp. NPDC058746]|uniref:hypothetical protein n=2 Tax=unclassified Streptomyces TaxID=2593676 RepID=UPI0036CBC6DF